MAWLCLRASAQYERTDIKPPFNLQWGEDRGRMERLLAGAKAKIVDRHMVDDREAWTVEGLLQQGLKRTVFYFKKDGMNEVELQYQDDTWDTQKYDEFMGSVRRKVEARFGPGQLIARSTQKEGSINQTVVGYKWTLNTTSIQLFYYSAEEGANHFRTVSIHYKTNL
jgi:hypothetical protein